MISITAFANIECKQLFQFSDKFSSQEEGTSSGEKFIVPNEFENHLYSEILKGRTGTLISVGTFRTLTDSAMGTFSKIIMLDYSRPITEFNRKNLLKIVGAKNRFEYIFSLLNLTPDAKMIKQLQNGSRSLTSISPYLREAIIKNFKASLPPEMQDAIMQIFDLGMLSAIMAAGKSEKRAKASLFWSDEVFNREKSNILSGKYQTNLGSLSGPTTLQALGDSMKLGSEKVSTIDVSNAIEHIIDYEGSVGLEKFIQNIETLPLEYDSVLLLTIDYDRYKGRENFPTLTYRLKQPLGDRWLYVAISIIEFIQEIRSTRIFSLKDYFNWLDDWTRRNCNIDDRFPGLLIKN